MTSQKSLAETALQHTLQSTLLPERLQHLPLQTFFRQHLAPSHLSSLQQKPLGVQCRVRQSLTPLSLAASRTASVRRLLP